MVARAAELAGRPRHYATDQFNNPYVIPDHRDNLGREIWEQSEGRVTAFCHGMGTASSVMGVSDALKPHGVFIQAHEPASSAAIGGGAARVIPHPGLDGPRDAALGSRQGRPRRADRRRRGDPDDPAPGRPKRGSSPVSRQVRTWSALIGWQSGSGRTR